MGKYRVEERLRVGGANKEAEIEIRSLKTSVATLEKENGGLKTRLKERVEEVCCLRATISSMEKEKEETRSSSVVEIPGNRGTGTPAGPLTGGEEGQEGRADIWAAVSLRKEVKDIRSFLGRGSRRREGEYPGLGVTAVGRDGGRLVPGGRGLELGGVCGGGRLGSLLLLLCSCVIGKTGRKDVAMAAVDDGGGSDLGGGQVLRRNPEEGSTGGEPGGGRGGASICEEGREWRLSHRC